MDLDSEKNDAENNEDDDKKQNSEPVNATPVSRVKPKTEPDNKYYEVEAILDGPKKRREHLFKLCYKVRWKGYGPEADTWQPTADLVNVQDMIDDFKKEKALKKNEKGKKKPMKKSPNRQAVDQSRNRSPSVDGQDDSTKKYDPVYGTVKDKFWKDLELGRHQNHTELFSGDMYSRVKGSRRVAHPEMKSGTQKHHQGRPPGQASMTSSRFSSRLLRGEASVKTRSVSPLSSKSARLFPNPSSPDLSRASRARKRHSYSYNIFQNLSTKRSRRSRGGNVSPEFTWPTISSVTSETVGIVTTSIPLTPPVTSSSSIESPLASAMEIISGQHTVTNGLSKSSSTGEVTSESDDDDDDAEDNLSEAEGGRMTVSSETMLTVTTETKRLDSESSSCRGKAESSDLHIRQPADKICSEGGIYPTQFSCVNSGASECAASDDSGGTSGGASCGPSVINKTHCMKRSPLDAQSEACGAVARSHVEECLWNGACNRSDCKSNRRRNMKNGLKKGVGGEQVNSEGEGHSTIGEDNGTDNQAHGAFSGSTVFDNSNNESHQDDPMVVSDNEEHNEGKDSQIAAPDKHPSHNRSMSTSHQSSSSSYRSSPTPRPAGARSKESNSHSTSSSPLKSGSKTSGGSPSRTSEQTKRLLFYSPIADSSDSSFDDGPSFSLIREAISDSFNRSEAQSLHRESTSSYSSRKSEYHGSSSSHGSSGRFSSQGTSERRKNLDGERPGLFSETFIFTQQDPGSSMDLSDSVPESHQGQSVVTSHSATVKACSPGKENFSGSRSKGSSQTSSTFTRQQMATGVPDTRPDADNQAQSQAGRSRPPNENLDSRAVRKRVGAVSQPLGKIPSPNSRDSELDQRISTLTCDELEDFVEQGEERYGHKDVTFISNADLLQAVNLSIAEVVKRAIKQSTMSDHRLDFEQPDVTGLTLLMRAVQRGTVAIVEMLLEHGVNVNAQQTNGTTALMIAAEQNGTCLVALLLKYGANSSLWTSHSDQAETALMKAIKRQHRDVVNLMLRVGVNIAAPTCTSMSVLELAVERRNPHIEGLVRFHYQRLDQAFRSQVLATLEGTADLMEPLFSLQCFPLRESNQFVVKFSSNIHPVAPGEGFLLFIAHTKITERGVRCRCHGGCPVSLVTLNGVAQSPLTKEVNFVTSCHPIVPGCNSLVIHKLPDYTSKAKLVVQAFRAKLLPC